MQYTNKICIIMLNMTEDYRDEYIVGIEKQANKLGYNTVTFSLPLLDEIHTGKEEEIYRLIDFDMYAGVVFFENSFSTHKALGNMVETLIHEKCTKPVIVLGDSLLFSETYLPDNSQGIEMLTNHVIEEHNCQILYYLGGERKNSQRNDAGFVRALKNHHLSCTDDNLIYGGYWSECGEALAKDIAYHMIEKPDGVICQNDTVAFFFIKALSKYGIRIPEDIIVTGYGARNDSRNNILSITTYPSNAEYHGRRVMSQLHAMISNSEEPQINFPKSKVITGMSCGCGNQKSSDIRLQLELHEEHRMTEICYRNSELEQKLYNSHTYKDLHPIILNSSYLIKNKTFISFNVKKDDTTSRCLYIRNHVWNDAPILFPSRELYPYQLAKHHAKNLHILPMAFNNQFLGHVVVGYDDPLVYTNILKRYISRLAIAISLIQSQNKLLSAKTQQDNIALTGTKKDSQSLPAQEVIFVQKGNSLHKVPLDNILLFETEERKTIVVMKNGRYEIKKTLSQLEELLAEKNFFRISKSTIVNLDKIVSITPDADRTLLATLTGKITVRVSRKNANQFKMKLNQADLK